MRMLAALLLGGALAVNALANRLPLGGNTTGELSARYPNLFVPAGVTFSIWGVIYLALLAWGVAQFLPSHREVARRIAPLFALSSGLNAGWLFAWHFQHLFLSVAMMGSLLGVLLRINLLLRGGERVLPRAAFGIYLGWICVATIANVTALLVGWEWSGAGLPDPVWAGLLVLVGGGVGGFATTRLRNPWLGWAVVWALGGIVLNRWADHPGVAVTAGMMMALVGALAVRAPE